MRYFVRKLFDFKLQIHAIETEPSLPLPADVIGHTVALMLDLYSEEGILTRTTTNEHLYKVVNYVNCVNMYIYKLWVFSRSLSHTRVEPPCACVVFIERESVLVMVLYIFPKTSYYLQMYRAVSGDHVHM